MFNCGGVAIQYVIGLVACHWFCRLVPCSSRGPSRWGRSWGTLNFSTVNDKFKGFRGKCQHAQGNVIRFVSRLAQIKMQHQICHYGKGYIVYHFVTHARSFAHGEGGEMGWFGEVSRGRVEKATWPVLLRLFP